MASNVENLIRGAVVKGIGKVADFNRKRLPRPTDAHPFLSGIHKPMEEEVTLEALRVDGEIPAAVLADVVRAAVVVAIDHAFAFVQVTAFQQHGRRSHPS